MAKRLPPKAYMYLYIYAWPCAACMYVQAHTCTALNWEPPPLHKLYACKYLYRHAQSCTVFEALKDQLLMNLRMKQLYNWNVVELVSLLNVICSYSWALSAIASCNHYTLSKLVLGVRLTKYQQIHQDVPPAPQQIFIFLFIYLLKPP